MAREQIIRVWCDMCLAVDIREEATHSDTIKVGTHGATKPRLLETCDRHFKEVVEPLLEALQVFGNIIPDDATALRAPATKRPTPQAGPFRCDVPGCPSGPLVNAASLSSHLRQMHSQTLKDYRARNGGQLLTATAAAAEPTLLDTGDSDAPPAAEDDPELKCPKCDKVYSRALGYNRPSQALGIHKAREHGIRSNRPDLVAKRAGNKKPKGD